MRAQRSVPSAASGMSNVVTAGAGSNTASMRHAGSYAYQSAPRQRARRSGGTGLSGCAPNSAIAGGAKRERRSRGIVRLPGTHGRIELGDRAPPVRERQRVGRRAHRRTRAQNTIIPVNVSG